MFLYFRAFKSLFSLHYLQIPQARFIIKWSQGDPVFVFIDSSRRNFNMVILAQQRRQRSSFPLCRYWSCDLHISCKPVWFLHRFWWWLSNKLRIWIKYFHVGTLVPPRWTEFITIHSHPHISRVCEKTLHGPHITISRCGPIRLGVM